MSYSRYTGCVDDNGCAIMPKVNLGKSSTDLVIVFKKRTMRLDNLSYKYYGDPNYGWLIMLANQKYGSLEYRIPDNAKLTIPYPLDDALRRYKSSLNIN